MEFIPLLMKSSTISSTKSFFNLLNSELEVAYGQTIDWEEIVNPEIRVQVACVLNLLRLVVLLVALLMMMGIAMVNAFSKARMQKSTSRVMESSQETT